MGIHPCYTGNNSDQTPDARATGNNTNRSDFREHQTRKGARSGIAHILRTYADDLLSEREKGLFTGDTTSYHIPPYQIYKGKAVLLKTGPPDNEENQFCLVLKRLLIRPANA